MTVAKRKRRSGAHEDGRKLQRNDTGLTCLECGGFLENTAGGGWALCRKGHGKLRTRLTPREVRFIAACDRDDLRAAEVDAVPLAEEIKAGVYQVRSELCDKPKRIPRADVWRLLRRAVLIGKIGEGFYKFRRLSARETEKQT